MERPGSDFTRLPNASFTVIVNTMAVASSATAVASAGSSDVFSETIPDRDHDSGGLDQVGDDRGGGNLDRALRDGRWTGDEYDVRSHDEAAAGRGRRHGGAHCLGLGRPALQRGGKDAGAVG